MSYYISEKLGNGYLRSGFQVLECTSGNMTDCLEYKSKCIADLFCHLLWFGFDKIYGQYINTSPQLGLPVFWISTTYQSWLKYLIPRHEASCKNILSYINFFTFRNESDRDNAMKEMQEYMDALFQALKKIDF